MANIPHQFIGRKGFISLGSITFPLVEKTGNYNVGFDDYAIEYTGGTYTVTLPSPLNITGKIYFIKNSGSGTITVSQLSTGAPVWDNTGNLTANTVISNGGLFLNKQTITANTVIPVGYSAHSAGPMTIANNITMTISSNTKWVIL